MFNQSLITIASLILHIYCDRASLIHITYAKLLKGHTRLGISYITVNVLNTSISHLPRLNVSRRSQINRFNKDMELFRRVRKRRLENNNRIVDVRQINFRNDKCNVSLMRLPVSPLVNLNHIVPFKTVIKMRSQVPFNPSPLLHSVGYQFKPERNMKYERFCEPYPMDEMLQIMDARSLGSYSRMSTKYKITGEHSEMPTPMVGQIVPPGGSIGKGYGFGLTKKPEPKNKPIPLESFKPFEPRKTAMSMDDYWRIKGDTKQYLENIKHTTPDDGAGKPRTRKRGRRTMPSDHSEFVSILEKTLPKVEGEVNESVNLPYMDDVCNEGDIMRNPRYLGEYRNKYWFHPFYGSPSMPSDAKEIIEKYNKEHPESKIDYETFRCDAIYCHSNGTIVHIEEHALPYDKEKDDFKMEGEDPREPRFVIQAPAGFIKKHNLQLGQIFEHVNQETREMYYDNIFFQPKSLRHPVYLPDGTKCH